MSSQECDPLENKRDIICKKCNHDLLSATSTELTFCVFAASFLYEIKKEEDKKKEKKKKKKKRKEKKRSKKKERRRK